MEWNQHLVAIAGTKLPAEGVLTTRNADGTMTAIRLVVTSHHATEEYGGVALDLAGDVLGTLREGSPDSDSIGAQVLEAARLVMPGRPARMVDVPEQRTSRERWDVYEALEDLYAWALEPAEDEVTDEQIDRNRALVRAVLDEHFALQAELGAPRVTDCAQELCPNWAGDGGCPCRLLGLEPPSDADGDE